MKRLYAPWRDCYTTDISKKITKEQAKNECPFCSQLSDNNDDKNFVLKRYTYTFVIFNRYPYNGGHLMVLPLAHKATLKDCTLEERCELIETINHTINILTEELKPHGFNVGLNMGKAGGGGIPSHLHFHVLPRWDGDSNFMPLLCDTKPVSIDLYKMYEQLKMRF